jgi:hypothetical protein
MKMSRLARAAIVGGLFLGLAVLGPGSAVAFTQFNQQTILLVHLPLGSGQFFTSNYVFTATQNATTINVKCFNDSGNRIGPIAGLNIAFSAAGQVAQHTPGTLGVLADPLFSNGTGWCWLNSGAGPPFVDYNIQETHGVTTDLTPGGILNSSSALFIGTSGGLAEVSTNQGGVPFWTTVAAAQHFLVLLNPLPAATTVSLRLFDTNGIAQGTGSLNRTLNPRSLISLSVPGGFALATPPTSGSIRITGAAAPGQGWTGWYLQVYANGRAIFNPIGLDFFDVLQLPIAFAP